MHQHSPTPASATEKLPQELLELRAAVRQLPEADRITMEVLVSRVVEATQRRKRILSLVQEALSQLRLDMKYLMFDLEATRRERDAFRRQLDSEDDAS